MDQFVNSLEIQQAGQNVHRVIRYLLAFQHDAQALHLPLITAHHIDVSIQLLRTHLATLDKIYAQTPN